MTIQEECIERAFIDWNKKGIYTAGFSFSKNPAKLNGEYLKWSETGLLTQHCWFKNGNEYGEVKWWDSSGNLIFHGFYKDGKKHGQNIYWDGGVKKLDKFYIDGNEIPIPGAIKDNYILTPEGKYYPHAGDLTWHT